MRIGQFPVCVHGPQGWDRAEPSSRCSNWDLWDEPSLDPHAPHLWGPQGRLCRGPRNLKSMACHLALPSRSWVLTGWLPLAPPLQKEGSWPASPLALMRTLEVPEASPVGGPSCHCESRSLLPPAHAAGFEGWPEPLVGTARCPNWASPGRRLALLPTCLHSGCRFALSRRTACFLIRPALWPARAGVHPCLTDGETETPGLRLGPCPKAQQGQARLPGVSPRKPSDTVLLLTLLANGMSSHRKEKKRHPFGSWLLPSARHRTLAAGIHENVSM